MDNAADLAVEAVDKQNATEAIYADSNEIKQSLKENCEFFLNFFIPDELIYNVPEFHTKIWAWLIATHIRLVALAIPRDHAKTTLAKLVVVWYWLFTDFRYVLYLSNTAPIAKDACRDIVAFIECDNFIAVFGRVDWVKRSDSEGLYIFKLRVTRANGEEYDKTCILKALGAGQQVRGLNIDNQRPELAIVDDLEDEENISTPYNLQKLKRWFYGTFRKALDKFGHKIIVIGNMISNKCILKELIDSEYWKSMRLGALLSNGEPLWPDAWTKDALKNDFREYAQANQAAVWFAEMMNMPIPEGMGLIQSEQITYHPHREVDDITTGFITIDPAISKKTAANSTAIVAHGIIGGRPEVLEYFKGKVGPIETFEITMRLAFKWQINVVGIESQAYQAALEHFFRYLLIERGIDGMEIVPLPAGERKVERLQAFCGMLCSGSYAIPDTDVTITDQLLAFDPSKTDNDDDLIDACAHGVQMLQRYYGLIMAATRTIIDASTIKAPELCTF